MLKLVMYWMLGMLTLAVGTGFVVIGLLAYEFLYEEYAFIIISIVFILLPLFVGMLTEFISDWQYNRKLDKKLKRMEEAENG